MKNGWSPRVMSLGLFQQCLGNPDPKKIKVKRHSQKISKSGIWWCNWWTLTRHSWQMAPMGLRRYSMSSQATSCLKYLAWHQQFGTKNSFENSPFPFYSHFAQDCTVFPIVAVALKITLNIFVTSGLKYKITSPSAQNESPSVASSDAQSHCSPSLSLSWRERPSHQDQPGATMLYRIWTRVH